MHTRGKAWPTATKPSHVPSQGPQCIFFGENDSSRKPQQLSLQSFVIVSFRAFPHGDRTLPEVNVLLNQSAAAAGNKIPPPPRLVGSSLLLPFHDSRRVFSFFFFSLRLPVKVLRPPSTLGAWPLKAPRPHLEERRGRRSPARGNALFRRAEECVMRRSAEGLLPVRCFLFLFVEWGHESQVGPAVARLPCLISETGFNTVVYVWTSD